MSAKNLLFIGAGNMGGAFIRGLLKHETHQITVVDPAKPDFDAVTVLSHIKEFDGPTPDAVILAVKPQIMEQVVSALREKIYDSLVISIAAGKKIAFFQGILGKNARIIRAMPNLPAAIGEGMTCWVGNYNLGQRDKETAHEILRGAGQVHELQEESAVDSWTAIAGSGPAFVFHFLECLSLAAEKLGFNKELSDLLAIQTTLGSAKLVKELNDEFITLRESVTSPGGTTAAGLAVLMEKLPELLVQTSLAAHQRSVELSG